MVQTAYGSLNTSLRLQAGQTSLIRGGTASVGLTAAILAKILAATVIATTRKSERKTMLKANGADYVVIDDGQIGSIMIFREISAAFFASTPVISAVNLKHPCPHSES